MIKAFSAIMVIAVVILLLTWLNQEPKVVKQVKAGEVALWCSFADGRYKRIPPEDIKGWNEQEGYTFFNGAAKSCDTVTIGE